MRRYLVSIFASLSIVAHGDVGMSNAQYLSGKIMSIAREKSGNQQSQEYFGLLSNNIDGDYVMQKILGKNYEVYSPLQRSQLRDIFVSMLARSLTTALTGQEQIKFVEEFANGANAWRVKSIMSFSNGKEMVDVDVDWYLGGDSRTNVKLRDIVAGGMSLIEANSHVYQELYREHDGNAQMITQSLVDIEKEIQALNR